MGRQVAFRLELRGTLRVVSALHVGTGGEERGVDLAVARDGQGRLYVPGTSLAGALRAWTAPARSGEARPWEHLWGESSASDLAEGWASRVLVEDGLVRLPGDLTFEEVRDGVGIDRCTGAARAGIKYERAVLPVGSLVDLAVLCDVASADATPAEDLLQRLRQALRARRIRLGAARSRGLGVVELMAGSDVLTREALQGRDEILDALVRRVGPGGRPLITVPPPAAEAAPRSSRLRLAIEWRPLGPLMVRAGTDGLGVDSLPLMAHVDGGRALLLPGSALKGMLRSHAERILRTVLELGEARGQRFQEQVECHPLVAWLFGSAPARDRGSAAGRMQPGLAALWVADCVAQDLIPAAGWQEVEAARWLSAADRQADPGRPLGGHTVREALDASGVLRTWDPVVHVALDRWTGGAADRRLYSVLEPHGVRWQPIVLELDFGRIERDLWTPAVALLLLVVDDLARGWLPLGYATNRGMGDVAVYELSVTVEAGSAEATEAAEEFAWLAGRYAATAGAGILGLLDKDRLAELRQLWRSWLDAQTARAGGVRP